MFPRWLWWTLLALVSWGVWAILSKLTGVLTAAHVQAVSTLGLYPIMLALYLMREPVTAPSPRGVGWAIAAGILSSAGNIPFFALLAGGENATTVIPLTAMAPLWTVLLAALLLKERLNRWQVGGIVCSLAAIYLFNFTGQERLVSRWFGSVLLCIFLWGTTGLFQKLSTNTLPATRSAIWFLAAFQPLAVAILIYEPLPTGVSWERYVAAVAVGFTLGLGNVAVLAAFACGGKASVILPLSNLYPLAALPLAIVLLGDKIENWRQAAGIALALASVVLLARESPAAPAPSEPPARTS